MQMELIDIRCYDLLHSSVGMDGIINVAKIICILSAICILLLSLDYYGKFNMIVFEFPLLVAISTLGMMLLVASKDLVTFYLSIELLSLSSYILASIKRNSQFSTEAGIKYFLLGAVSSGILLFGSSLLYALTGETTFQGLATFM